MIGPIMGNCCHQLQWWKKYSDHEVKVVIAHFKNTAFKMLLNQKQTSIKSPFQNEAC